MIICYTLDVKITQYVISELCKVDFALTRSKLLRVDVNQIPVQIDPIIIPSHNKNQFLVKGTHALAENAANSLLGMLRYGLSFWI